MATIREYFEKDLSLCLKVYCALPLADEQLEAIMLYDLIAATAYVSVYIPPRDDVFDTCLGLLGSLKYGKTQLSLAGKITLPVAAHFPGEIRVENKPGDFKVAYRLYGDPKWRSTNEVASTTRIFIYSESDLGDDQILKLQESEEAEGHQPQFRSHTYRAERERFEVPLAFISHDSRDKEDVARPIAVNLQQRMCPVWYDEFSLPVGARLRQSIEKGLKECKKCILILSPAFFENDGWTKTEFDAIFTREIIEGGGLILPVWHGVDKQQVYDYSPSLLNIKGLDWRIGAEEVCTQLHREILREPKA